MATEALKSTPVTNSDATPPTFNSNQVDSGFVRSLIGAVTTVTGKTTGSTYRLCRVKSSDRISSVHISCAALGASTACDFGFYRTAADGGAVVSAAAIASAVDLSSALTRSDITYEATTWSPGNQHYQIWQILALASDPMVDYDFTATSTATINTGGFLAALMTVVRN